VPARYAYNASVWRVLLVDDSALVRNSMQAALEPYGLELEHAEHGEIAVAKAMASSWDLIFLDVVMPHMDGPTALREIRARGNTTPVVLVTSVSTATVVASAVKLGNVYYIAKPFTPTHIRAIATKLLKLDPAVLASPPRVLLQHTDRAAAEQLRPLLPGHIALDTSQSGAQSLELVEAGKHDLVLLESSARPGELVPVADAIRRARPAAAIFAMSDDATAATAWQPHAGLDGLLPRIPDAALIDGFLVPTFLRPLVVVERSTARVTGFRGAPAHLAAYVTTLARALVDRCRSLDHSTALEIDLRRIPADPDACVSLVTHVDRALRAIGAAPAFQLAPELRAATQGRLERVVIA
jgi:DNA-binding response OmpR family regulator